MCNTTQAVCHAWLVLVMQVCCRASIVSATPRVGHASELSTDIVAVELNHRLHYHPSGIV